MAQVVTHREKLNRIHEEVRQALEADDAVGIVVADGNFADFIAKNDRGLLGKVIVGVAEGIPPVGVLFIKENLGRTSGRYQLFSWSKDDQVARLLVQKVLDKILTNGKYDPFQDLPEPTPEQKAAFRAELDSMMDKTTITCSRCGGKNPANSEHCYKCGQAIAGAPNSSGLASVLHEEPQAGTQSLGDLSGCDANKLTEELRDLSSRLRDDKEAQENALDKPHHLIFYSAVDQHGETRLFDLMSQSDGFSIAETATRAAKLGKCVETIYSDSDGVTHHVHRLYGKFYASSARKAIDHFAGLTGLSQVTEIAETQTLREAQPTWRFIYKKLGAVPRTNPPTQDNSDRKDAANTSREPNANVESKGTAKAPLTHEELLNEKKSGKRSPSGIGGWLAFFVFALFASGAMLLFQSLNMPFEMSNALAMGTGLSLAALAFLSAILILRKNPRGILLSKVFIGANLLVSILAVIGSISDTNALGAASVGLGKVLLSSLVWITYLHQSVRVKNTFRVAAEKGQAGFEETTAPRQTARTIPTSLTMPATKRTTKQIAVTVTVLIVAVTIALVLIATEVGNKSKTSSQSQDPATPQELPPPFNPPTATEAFNLRTKCTQLAEQLDESLPYGRNWHRDTVSNYSARSNRCYVEMTDSNESIKEYDRNLYDGQTRDLLAFTKTHGDPCCRHNQVGMIFIDNNLDTVSDCKEGGDCGYGKVNDFIDQKMKREE